ncbi:hypothetical protein ACQJBY_042117 [Aegilops geniculata]
MDAEGMEFLLDAVDRFPVREEFADSLDHPDPVPLLYLLEKGSAAQGVGEVNGVSGLAQMEDEGAAADKPDGGQRFCPESPARSAQSTDRVNPQAHGWTKRLRLGSAPPDRVPCSSRMSALEISIRKYAEQPDKSVVRPELGLSFEIFVGRLAVNRLRTMSGRHFRRLLTSEPTTLVSPMLCWPRKTTK